MASTSFASKAIHGGQSPDKWNSKSIIPPISMTSTYKLNEVSFPKEGEFIYTRLGNPTRDCLQEAIAEVENAKYSFVFSSGMATITNVMQGILKTGDECIICPEIYGGTYKYVTTYAENLGINFRILDFSKTEDFSSIIKPETKMMYFESLTNPLLTVPDIELLVKNIRKIREDMVIVVDNTFFTPYYLRPLELGVDIVIHSVTKYINGHSDIIMGVASCNKEELKEKIFQAQWVTGSVPSPFDSFLANRGLKTLHIRMKEHSKNGYECAKWLESCEHVEKCLFPGLESHPDHKTLKKLNLTAPGMISFYLKGSFKDTEKFLKSLKMITLAVSLGGFETLIEHPATMTHCTLPEEHRLELGITDTFIRMSLGLEDSQDIIQDLQQAMTIAFGNDDEVAAAAT